MNPTSTYKHYLKMALSGAGGILLLFLALCLIVLALDKTGLDREIIHIILLGPVWFAIYRMGVLKAFLGMVFVVIVAVVPLVLLYHTPPGKGLFNWINEVFPG